VSLELPELRTIDIDGPVVYRQWDGPSDTTFVCVHGLGASHLSWVQVAPALAGFGRVLALDLQGFGGTPLAGRGAALMDLRRTLSRFVAQLGSDRVVLSGNSMGGVLSILQAAVEPSSVAGIALTDPVMPRVRGAWPHPAIVAAFMLYNVPGVGEAVVGARMRRMDPERSVRLGFSMIAADPRSIPDEVIRLHVEQYRLRRHDPDAVEAFVEATRSLLRLGKRPSVARRALNAVRCPVLLLHGRRDRFVPAAFAEAELARHPEWRSRFFPDLGHAPQMEAPGRWLAEVADWFAEKLA
jgi:pimeloyl-ACP methyl ester carboxylesterase